MKLLTTAVCPRCGEPLYVSDLDRYNFVCFLCDENFYGMEVKKNRSELYEISLKMSDTYYAYGFRALSDLSEKYKCEFLGYDNEIKVVDFGWEKGFPPRKTLLQFKKDIQTIVNQIAQENDRKFRTMKQRDDYRFSLNEGKNVIADLRNRWMLNLLENGDPIRGAAVLELGYVDIELNITTFEQCGKPAQGKEPVLNYFICLKNSDNEWRSYDYVDYAVHVDWYADNWEELLERDMFLVLNLFVQNNNFSYDNPN